MADVQFSQQDYKAFDDEVNAYAHGARTTVPKLSTSQGVMENGRIDASLYEPIDSQLATQAQDKAFKSISSDIGRQPLPGEIAGHQFLPGEEAGKQFTPGAEAGLTSVHDAGAKAGNGGGHYSLSPDNLADTAKACQTSGACQVDGLPTSASHVVTNKVATPKLPGH